VRARPVRAGVVSVVIVNYRNADDTLQALDGAAALQWPPADLEVVVVDNGSGDSSAERIAKAHPEARMVVLDANTGFAGGCNRGVDAATGEYVAFLNNDARPDPAWLTEAVAVLRRDLDVACVASKVLDWSGTVIDFVGSAITFYGHGLQLHAGEPDTGRYDTEADVPFATGAAMVMPADVFRRVGGFDERYFMFFEDVDLGWRLWLLGHRVRYVPTSVVYHRGHATISRYGEWQHQFLLERNALFTVFKNCGDESLGRLLPAALMLAVRRGVVRGDTDTGVLDLARGGDHGDDRLSIDKRAAAGTFAVDAFVEAMPGLREDRERLQAARRRRDPEIFARFGEPLFANIGDASFVTGFRATVEALGVDEVFEGRHRVLVVTGDVLGATMAGPAIRAWHIASALATEHDVHLVTTSATSTGAATIVSPDFAVSAVDERALARLESWCDVIVLQGNRLREHKALRRTRKVLVVDLYDPFHLEVLEGARRLGPRDRLTESRRVTAVLNEQLARGDVFLCASPKQRDFWLGQLAAVGRVNPLTYDRDATMGSLIKLVPFGVPDDPPRATRPVLRGVVPGIGSNDKVVLWGGGLYDWLDPLTLIRAVDRLRDRVPEVRLFFLGLGHPNPRVGEMRVASETVALGDELGLTGTHVFFNETWVDYDDRQNYLLESDVGVSTHLEHVETAFSFRTRVLDYLWASLPVVATSGDAFADIVEQHALGIVVPPGDVDALEDALYQLLADADRNAACRTAISTVVPELRWSRTLQPLVELCRAPARAPDLLDPETAVTIRDPLPHTFWRRQRLERDVRAGLAALRAGQVRDLATRVVRRFGGRRRAT